MDWTHCWWSSFNWRWSDMRRGAEHGAAALHRVLWALIGTLFLLSGLKQRLLEEKSSLRSSLCFYSYITSNITQANHRLRLSLTRVHRAHSHSNWLRICTNTTETLIHMHHFIYLHLSPWQKTNIKPHIHSWIILLIKLKPLTIYICLTSRNICLTVD